MCVHEAEPRRFRDKGDTTHPMRRDEGGPLLGGTIDIARKHLSVPMNEFRHVGIVVDIDHEPLSLLQRDQWPGELTVVERRRYDMLRRKLDETGGDTQR